MAPPLTPRQRKIYEFLKRHVFNQHHSATPSEKVAGESVTPKTHELSTEYRNAIQIESSARGHTPS